MARPHRLIFDDVIIKQLRKITKKHNIERLLFKAFDELELAGPYIANLLDSKLFVYEYKVKRPPLRLYFKHDQKTDELYIFEFEIKRSQKKQQKTIKRIKHKAANLDAKVFSGKLLSFFYILFKLEKTFMESSTLYSL